MQKGTQPSQVFYGGHITPNPTQKSIRVMPLCLWEYKLDLGCSVLSNKEFPWKGKLINL